MLASVGAALVTGPSEGDEQESVDRDVERHAAGIAVVAATFAALLALSWRRWPDVLIDFGRELYVPWQLTEGRLLYRDIAHEYGPLSMHVNALWFRAFGVSLLTIALANLAILGVLTGAIFRIFFKTSGSALVASIVCIAFLCLSGFAHALMVGNYNFVCPYSHEVTHGIFLSVLMILVLARWLERGKTGSAALSGFILGLVFLTKPEIVLAASGVAALAIVLVLARRADTRRRTVELAAFGLAFLVPPTAFFLFFVQSMPARDALRGVLGAFVPVLSADVGGSVFYRWCMGLDRPLLNAWVSALAAGRVLLLVAALALFEKALSMQGWARIAQCAATLLVALGILALRGFELPFLLDARALALLTVPRAVVLVRHAILARRDPTAFARAAPMALWAAFASLLLVKIALYVRMHQYGFALAMPAMLLHVSRLVGPSTGAPAFLTIRRHGIRALIVLLVALDLLSFLSVSARHYGRKVVALGSGGDRFLVYDRTDDWRTAAAELLLERIARLPPGAEVLVLPEGVMLDYLSRRSNGARLVNFLPGMSIVGGEAAVCSSLAARPPDYVVLLSRNTQEFGVPPFGTDAGYGRLLRAWVDESYVLEERVGAEPFRSYESLGFEIRKRRS